MDGCLSHLWSRDRQRLGPAAQPPCRNRHAASAPNEVFEDRQRRGAVAAAQGGDGHLFNGAVVEGSCRLQVDGREPLTLEVNDFVLIPAAADFVMTSLHPAA